MENVTEEEMSFVLKPTLKHMTMVSIAVAMWTRDDVMALMPKLCDRGFSNKLDVVIKLKENLQHLPLPDLLKSQLSVFIRPIGRQIFQWNQYLYHQFSLERMSPKELCWTPQGTIDKEESVRVLVRDQRLDVVNRYRLACTYCLTDEIHKLTKELPEGSVLDIEDIVESRRRELVVFWTCSFAGDLAHLNAIMEKYAEPHLTRELYAFQSAVSSFNSAATKYFYDERLNPFEKETITTFTKRAISRFSFDRSLNFYFTPHDFFPDLVCTSLARMEREQQNVIFRKRNKKVLKCLLIWPYQCLFVEAAKRWWKLIRKEGFETLLWEIFEEIDHDCRNCVYRDIFRQFWELGSVEFRKFVIRKSSFLRRVAEMVENGEEELCRMVLSQLDAAERQTRFNRRYHTERFYADVIRNRKWKTLDFFLEECAPTEKTIAKVRSSTKEFGNRVYYKQKIKFKQILDDYVADLRNNVKR